MPVPILRSTFTFIWDTWEDKIVVPLKTIEPIRNPVPVEWIPIINVIQSPGEGPDLNYELFLITYSSILSNPDIFPQIKTNTPATPPRKTESVCPEPEATREGHECTICGTTITLQFHECTHGACASCTSSLYRSRIQHQHHFPQWFPCPFCRTEVHHIGVVSAPDSQTHGFGTETEHGTVWNWTTVRRWAAVHSEGCGDIAARLKVRAMGDRRYLRVVLMPNTRGTGLGVYPLDAKEMQGMATDQVEEWREGILLCFIILGEHSLIQAGIASRGVLATEIHFENQL